MDRVTKAVELFGQGYMCSQAVFAAFSEDYGVTEKQALQIGACFGSGMNKGEVCGACTGATPDGRKAGTVTDYEDIPGNPCIYVDTENGQEVLVPLHEDLILSVDPERRELTMDLPDGLIP